MTLIVEMPQELLTKLQQEAARRGQEPSVVVVESLNRTLPQTDLEDAEIEAGWEALMQLIEDHQMDTGITDLAHQHDHYLHGTPKREPYEPGSAA